MTNLRTTILVLILGAKLNLGGAAEAGAGNMRASRKAMEMEEDSIYWDNSCPWEMTHLGVAFSKGLFFDDPEYLARPKAQTREEFVRAAEVSKEYSLYHQTPQRFRANADVLRERKTVVVGDSLSRQLYISMACLLPHGMIVKHATPWMFGIEHAQEFFDARIRLQSPLGTGAELYYSPKAGAVNDYDWNQDWSGDWAPIISEGKEWLSACRERRPFQFDANELPLEGTEFWVHQPDDEETRVETITLNKNDVVVISAGIHSKRPENLASIEALLDCMDEERAKGEADLDWPHLVYWKTSMKHFGTPINGYHVCTNANYHTEDEVAEIKQFGDRLHMIGKHVNYTEMGYMHVGALIPDCTHWFQPGLTDLQAVDVVDYISQIDELDANSR